MYEAGDADQRDEALAAFGLVLEQEEGEAYTECWPDNEKPLQVFEAMSTQWNVGPSNVLIGLRYESLPFVLRALRIKTADHAEMLQALRVMEQEALAALNR